MIARTVALPDPTLTPLERELLDAHPVELQIRATDIENECEHGHLPFDRNPGCECWTRQRTAALLGQAPDDGCPGLDRAATLDLPIPQIEVPRQGSPDLVVSASSTTRGGPMEGSNSAGPVKDATAQVMHDWYMVEGRTMADVADYFSLSTATIKRRFDEAGLACKPRGGDREVHRRIADERDQPAPAPAPESAPVSEYAPAIVALERELLAVRLRASKLEDAIEALRGLTA